MITTTEHAETQASSRGLPMVAVLAIVQDKLEGNTAESVACRVVVLPEQRGGLVGSNGNEVWAIVRDDEITTIMFRRSNQPRDKASLKVRRVIL